MRSILFLAATLFLMLALGACQEGDATPAGVQNGELDQELDETEVAVDVTEPPATATGTPTATSTAPATQTAPATETSTPTTTITPTVTMTPTAEATAQLDPTAVAGGQELFLSLGCSTCHPGGSAGTGPSLIGLFGREVQLRSGETVIADEAYVRRSILDPNAQIVAGYEPIMPSFEDQLSSEELDRLIAYIRSLSENE